MTDNPPSRRAVLRWTATAAGATGLAGVTAGGLDGSASEKEGQPDDTGRPAHSKTSYNWVLETGEGPTPPGSEFQGDPAEYAAAWAAKELCTRIFVADGDPQPTMANELRGASALAPGFAFDLADVQIDEARERVTVDHPGQPARTAVRADSQGCVILPSYSGELHFEPRTFQWEGPAADEPWPRGEELVAGDGDVDRTILDATLDAHMATPAVGTSDAAGARAVAIVHRGELVGERYHEQYGRFTPQRSWSVNKSLTSTLVGMMVDRGWLDLDEPVPVAAWLEDDRCDITLRHLLNMASGLDQNNTTGDPRNTFLPENEHAFVYFDGFDTVADAIENPARIPPGDTFEYRNANVLIAAALAREAAAHEGRDPMSLLHREVFEPLGMRSSIQEHDPYGNAIGSGLWFGTAGDMARLGLLHVNDGVFAGERLLSEEWIEYVSTPSETTDQYSGFWWQDAGDDCDSIPEDAYYASGAFGQFILVVPSYDLVISRLGVNFPEDPVGMCQLATGAIEAIESGDG